MLMLARAEDTVQAKYKELRVQGKCKEVRVQAKCKAPQKHRGRLSADACIGCVYWMSRSQRAI
eukprot:3211071-Rhodomonas_salina.2